MITSVEIKGLRGIKEGKLEGLTPLVVLVGPNGCGKSTVLEALLLGASQSGAAVVDGVSEQRPRIEKATRWLAYRGDPNARVEVTVKTSEGRARTTRLKRGGNQANGNVDFEVVIAGGKQEPDRQFAMIGDGGTGYTGLEDRLGGVESVRLIPANRRLDGQKRLVTLYSEAVEQGRRTLVRDILTNAIPGLVDVSILMVGDSPVVGLEFADHAVPIAVAGDGADYLAGTCLGLASAPNGVVLVEEPETHLHPKAARQSARSVWAAVRRGIQVVLTTQSIEYIDALLEAVNSDAEMETMTVVRLQLREGCLGAVRLTGNEAVFSRVEIGDDLR